MHTVSLYHRHHLPAEIIISICLCWRRGVLLSAMRISEKGFWMPADYAINWCLNLSEFLCVSQRIFAFSTLIGHLTQRALRYAEDAEKLAQITTPPAISNRWTIRLAVSETLCFIRRKLGRLSHRSFIQVEAPRLVWSALTPVLNGEYYLVGIVGTLN